MSVRKSLAWGANMSRMRHNVPDDYDCHWSRCPRCKAKIHLADKLSSGSV